MANKSLNDLAIETMTQLAATEQAAKKYCDFGSVLGVRDEMEMIQRELTETLHRVSLRAMYLKMRIEKWEEGNREVGLL